MKSSSCRTPLFLVGLGFALSIAVPCLVGCRRADDRAGAVQPSGSDRQLVVDPGRGAVRRLRPSEARVEAWEFLLGGGAASIDPSWEYVPGAQAVDTQEGREIRRQLGVLKRFTERLSVLEMRPAGALVQGGLEPGTWSKALVEPGRTYVVYLHHGAGGTLSRAAPALRRSAPRLALEPGSYRVEWLDPASGKALSQSAVTHSGATGVFLSPAYAEDIVLLLERTQP